MRALQPPDPGTPIFGNKRLVRQESMRSEDVACDMQRSCLPVSRGATEARHANVFQPTSLRARKTEAVFGFPPPIHPLVAPSTAGRSLGSELAYCLLPPRRESRAVDSNRRRSSR
jgi:hypothetical protein